MKPVRKAMTDYFAGQEFFEFYSEPMKDSEKTDVNVNFH